MRERGGGEGGSFNEAPVLKPPLTLPSPLRGEGTPMARDACPEVL
ncbi:hypothetical protein CBM2634_B160406 [Cupriavidus taiwanensis]|uniref:Uncharacterized protein n=1 Tax=Cupriavidus taiwanensis TaxID=164546 RepID=A0A375J8S4_9BURK|nr:hypothetical protein CBM2634_B160406 [Cupriavidus taiwanensis]